MRNGASPRSVSLLVSWTLTMMMMPKATGAIPIWRLLRPSVANAKRTLMNSPSFIFALPHAVGRRNPFAALNEIDDHDKSDDEDKVINALRQISRNVTVGPNVPQRSKKDPAPISKKKLRKIVAAIDNGNLSLPDAMSRCDTDSEVEYVWALVDSGS